MFLTHNTQLTLNVEGEGAEECCFAEGEGTYVEGTIVTLNTFDGCGWMNWHGWSDGNYDMSRQITVNSNINLKAYWSDIY